MYKNSRHPVDYAVKIILQLRYVVIVAVAAHIVADIAFAHPVKRAFPKILTVSAAGDVFAPLLNICILTVAELLFSKRYERAGIYRVE